MTSPTNPTRPGRLLTEADEISLAQGQEARVDGAVPDTLEVRSDAASILRGTIGGLRRPVLMGVAVVGAAAVLAAVIGVLSRRAAGVAAPQG